MVVGTDITSGSYTIVCDSDSDVMHGMVTGVDTDDGTTGYAWAAPASADTITLDSVATGGKIGDTIYLEDVATNVWAVSGFITQSGGSEATPFSAAL